MPGQQRKTTAVPYTDPMFRTNTLESLTAVGACEESIAWIKSRQLYDGQQAWDQMDVGHWMIHWLASCVQSTGDEAHAVLWGVLNRTVSMLCPPLELTLVTDAHHDAKLAVLSERYGIRSPADMNEALAGAKAIDPFDPEKALGYARMCMLYISKLDIPGRFKNRHAFNVCAGQVGYLTMLGFAPRERGRVSRMIAVLCRTASPSAPLAPGCRAIQDSSTAGESCARPMTDAVM